jgi:hypothetical protein
MRNIMHRIAWIGSFMILFMFSLYFLKEPLYRGMVTWMMKSEFKDRFGQYPDWDSMEIEGEIITLRNIDFFNSVSDPIGGYHFEVEEIVMQTKVNWKARKLDLAMNILRPKITIVRRDPNQMPLWEIHDTLPYYFDTEWKFEVFEGGLELREEFGESQSIQRFHIVGDTEQRGGRKGQFTFAMNEFDTRDGSVRIALQGDGKEATAEVEVKGLSGARFAQFFQFWIGRDGNNWEISEGKVDGKLIAVWNDGKKPYLDGNLEFSRFRFNNSRKEIFGAIDKGRLKLNETGQGNPSDSTPFGQFEFLEGATFTYLQNGIPLWDIKDLQGGIYLYPNQPSEIDLEGICSKCESPTQLKVEGRAELLGVSQPYADLMVTLIGFGQKETSIRFLAKMPEQNQRVMEFQCMNLTKSEFHAIQQLLSSTESFSFITESDLLSGSLDLSLRVHLNGQNMGLLECEKIEGSNLVIDRKNLGVIIGLEKISGGASCDFSEASLIPTINTDLELINAEVKFCGINQCIWNFTDINTRLVVKNGVIDNSTAKATFAGLKGEMELNWLSSNEVIRCQFDGKFDDLSLLLPSEISQNARKGFSGDELAIGATMKRKGEMLGVEGRLVVRGKDRPVEEIRFGFDLESTSNTMWCGVDPSSSCGCRLQENSRGIARALLPRVATSAAVMADQFLYEEFGQYGQIIRNGWVKGNNLNLNKYVSTFLFNQNAGMELTGLGDLEGHFTNNRIAVRYAASGAELISTDFSLTVDKVGGDYALVVKNPLPGIHFFDLRKRSHFGFLPLKEAVYTQKNLDMEFTRMNALTIFQGEEVHLHNVEAFSKMVHFTGKVDIDYSSPRPGESTVCLTTSEISGPVAHVQELLKKFDSQFFTSIPLEGKVYSGAGGGYLKVDLYPNRSEIEANVRGQFTDGAIHPVKGDFDLENLSFEFDYTKENNTLFIREMRGDFFVGDRGAERDRYDLHSKETRLYGFPQAELDFDFSLSDTLRDYVRLKGRGSTVVDAKQGEYTLLSFDGEKTYIGQFHPKIQILALKDWKKILAFRAEPEVNMATISDDLSRFAKSGFFFASSKEVEALKDWDANGKIRGNVNFDPKNGGYQFAMRSEGLAFNEVPLENFTLNGKKLNEKWMIDQFQMGKLSIAADMVQLEKEWKLSFLGLRMGESILMGLEGSFIPANRTVQANMNLLEINVGKMKEFATLQELSKTWNPDGKIRASGKMNVEIAGPGEWFRMDSQLNASYRGLKFGGIGFKDHENLSCRYTTKEGLVVQNFNATIQEIGQKRTDIQFEVEKFSYNPVTQGSIWKGLHFDLPVERLGWVLDVFEKTFPREINSEVVDTVMGLKGNEKDHLAGLLEIETTPGYRAVQVQLDEGEYQLFGQKHQLKNFSLQFDPYEIRVKTKKKLNDNYYWMHARSSAPDFNSGQVILGVENPAALADKDKKPLTVLWEKDPVYGVIIESADGEFEGVKFNLIRTLSEPQKKRVDLTGRVVIDFAKAAPLFGKEVSETIKTLELGSGYELNGKISVSRDSADDVNFDGVVIGRDFVFKGYDFKTLYAKLEYGSTKFSVKDLKMIDVAGQMKIDRLSAEKKKQGKWYVSMPKLVVEDFRPSQLKETGKDIGEPKAFMVNLLELNNIEGELTDPKTLRGNGYFSFVNPTRKNFRNTILSIPGEILSRIGIDPNVMTPVVGTVNYNIQNGRFYFTELKDVYSEGRISKFYLPNEKQGSYMMKQYNLIFKLAELFTFSIQGNLEEPVYSLQKRNVTRGDEGYDEKEMGR